jgi:hypothetical protein
VTVPIKGWQRLIGWNASTFVVQNLKRNIWQRWIDALRVTASGKWGLFDHNADRWSRKAVAPVIENLAEIGQAIDQMREQLGMPPSRFNRNSSHLVGLSSRMQ